MTRKNLRGPGVFVAQFQSDSDTRFKGREACCKTFAATGMTSIELPLWWGEFDRKKALTSANYVADFKGACEADGISVAQVTDHLFWQNVCVSPALKAHTCGLTGHTSESTVLEMMAFSQQAVKDDIDIAVKFGLKKVGGWSGPSGVTHIGYPWPPLPEHVIYAADAYHAKQWLPLLQYADDRDVDLCWEFHPQHNVVSGAGFQRYLPHVQYHRRLKELLDLSHKVLQGIPAYVMPAYIRYWGTNTQRPDDPVKNRIGLLHIKDALAEIDFNMGTLDYGSFDKKSHRFRSLGRGCIPYLEVCAALDELGEPYTLVEEWEDCGDGNGVTVGKEQALQEGVQCINAWLAGEPTPELGEVRPHNDGGFEAFAAVNLAGVAAEISAITGIPIEEVVIDPRLTKK